MAIRRLSLLFALSASVAARVPLPHRAIARRGGSAPVAVDAEAANESAANQIRSRDSAWRAQIHWAALQQLNRNLLRHSKGRLFLFFRRWCGITVHLMRLERQRTAVLHRGEVDQMEKAVSMAHHQALMMAAEHDKRAGQWWRRSIAPIDQSRVSGGRRA